MRHFLNPVQLTNVVQAIDARGQAAMQTEDLRLHQRSERKVVKEVSEDLPHIGIPVLAEALIIETVNLSDLSALMVTTENGDAIWVPDFQSNQECGRLHGVISSINIVAHEKVVRVWGLSSNSEQLSEVMELAMDISTDGDRAPHRLNIALINKNLPRLVAQRANLKL